MSRNYHQTCNPPYQVVLIAFYLAKNVNNNLLTIHITKPAWPRSVFRAYLHADNPLTTALTGSQVPCLVSTVYVFSANNYCQQNNQICANTAEARVNSFLSPLLPEIL